MNILDEFVRRIISLFSGDGPKSRLLILTYHRVRERADFVNPGDPDKVEFAAQMRMLAKYFDVVSVSQAIQDIRCDRLAERSVCITFDDGYADNHEVAAPILEEMGLVATFFVATGYLNGGMMWNDRIIEAIRHLDPGTHDFGQLGRVDISSDDCRSKFIRQTIGQLKYMRFEERDRISKDIAARCKVGCSGQMMMTDDMVRDLHVRGMEIGAHTVTHPILSQLSDSEAKQEVHESKSYLESLLRTRVTSFAYPNGRFGKDLTSRDVNIVRDSGFDVAVTTDWGAVTAASENLALPRVGISGGNMTMALLRLCRDYRTEMNRVLD